MPATTPEQSLPDIIAERDELRALVDFSAGEFSGAPHAPGWREPACKQCGGLHCGGWFRTFRQNEAAAKAEADTLRPRVHNQRQEIVRLETAIAKLQSELEEARRDAERYRWLRDDGDAGDHHIVLMRLRGDEVWCGVSDYDKSIDAAIDSAITSASGGRT